MKKFLMVIGIPLILSGCQSLTENTPEPVGQSMTGLVAPDIFDFQTSGPVTISIRSEDADKNPLPGVPVEIRYQVPGGQFKTIGRLTTGTDGNLETILSLPDAVKQIAVRTDFIGLIRDRWMPISAGRQVSYLLSPDEIAVTTGLETEIPPLKLGKQTAFQPVKVFLSPHDASGRPLNRATSDVISAGLLTDINASLPEGRPVPQFHPDYLSLDNNPNAILTEQADVWITFVHEGAGWRNSLGYYTFPVSDPPTSPDEIDTIHVIFPNVSFINSGGTLRSGDKMFLGRFPAGTGIGWVLIANGWTGSTVAQGYYPVFSDPILNSESDRYKKQHTVFLADTERGLALLGFEDINREETFCDNDFNDAVFYVTSNPVTAIETGNLPPIDKPGDRDGDLVSDLYDDYPDDPLRAFDLTFPAENTPGTLAFEDQWPVKGDYDFNDLVISYNFTEVTNAAYQVIDIRGTVRIEAAGAGQQNGFAIHLPVPASQVTQVTGFHPVRNYTSLNANGTESGQQQAVVILFESADYLFSRPPGFFVNTQISAPPVSIGPQELVISFSSPVSKNTLGNAPYNPFLIASRDRGREVHLPGQKPTALANSQLFGTGDDQTSVSQNRFYRTGQNLPWAVQITDEWKWPLERVEVSQAWNGFFQWASSGGSVRQDWYLIRPENYLPGKVYSR